MSGRIASGPRSLDPKELVVTSPLKLFGQAKNQINDLFSQLSVHIKEGNVFIKGFCYCIITWSLFQFQ